MAFSAIADAKNATERLYDTFMAELLTEHQVMDKDLDVAVRVENASFAWDAPSPEVQNAKKKETKRGKSSQPEVSQEKAPKPEKAFQMKNINFDIPRGSLVAFVGPVGSGKSSLLQGLIGEMRKTEGNVTFGGSVGYCSQSAWIQVSLQLYHNLHSPYDFKNATIRENICFGRPFEEERYWKAVKDSCLEPDLELLPNYDMTEVGEKVRILFNSSRFIVLTESFSRAFLCRAVRSNA